MAVHALTGCDTVPKMYGTGKKKSLNIMKKKKLRLVLDRMPVILISCFMKGHMYVLLLTILE